LVSGCCMYTFITGTLCFFLIEELRLIGDGFIGTIPSEFGRMTNMMFFVAADTSFEGSIPPALFDGMRKLIEFELYSTEISGEIPTEIGYLESLVECTFVNIDLSGTIPTEVGLLTSLVALEMQNTGCTGTLPTELGRMVSLAWLTLSNNDLQGTIPIELEQLNNLEKVIIKGNPKLTGTTAPDLCNLQTYELEITSFVDCPCCTNRENQN